ncbi:MAG: SAM-dependent methyltransferase [Segetibacter sp.]|nr:SAM-dependent methyltransferase [Segetibacter sp.]
MDTQQAYNTWANTYDTVANKTRDLELIAAKEVLQNADFSEVLEIGCGTGKNTRWLQAKSNAITAVVFSEEMMKQAQTKITANNVTFKKSDRTKEWNFKEASLIIISLVVEHIEDIDFNI